MFFLVAGNHYLTVQPTKHLSDKKKHNKSPKNLEMKDSIRILRAVCFLRAHAAARTSLITQFKDKNSDVTSTQTPYWNSLKNDDLFDVFLHLATRPWSHEQPGQCCGDENIYWIIILMIYWNVVEATKQKNIID